MWASPDGTGFLVLWRAPQGYLALPWLSSRGRHGLAGAKFGSRIRKTDICKHSLDQKCRDNQYMFFQKDNVKSGIKRKHNRSSVLFQLEQDLTYSIPCPRDEEKVTQRQLPPAPLSRHLTSLQIYRLSQVNKDLEQTCVYELFPFIILLPEMLHSPSK